MFWDKSRATLLLAAALLCACTGQESANPVSTPSETPESSESAATGATVMRRDFQISYQLDATTVAATSVPLRPPNGMRWERLADAGTIVQPGEAVGEVAVDPTYRAALEASAKANRVDAARLAHLNQQPQRTITAPVSGTIALNEGSLSLTAPGVVVTVPLTGIQQLRMDSVDLSATASVETIAGRRTVACAYLWIDALTSNADGNAASLNCRLPQVVETVGGLRAQLHVTSPVIKDAVVVPEAMLGQDDSGYTVTVVQDGKPAVIGVDVGPGNGVVRVITSQLPVGAEIVRPNQ